ncbi:uncharacterized protein METZ01_LOCUS374000, partial [marine metagenome]
MIPKINIAIDGYSSCGKSTIAKAIAHKFGMRYIDTGAMYRAITLYCIENNIIDKYGVDLEKLGISLNNIEVSFEYNIEFGTSETYLNDSNVEKIIRNHNVSSYVSVISQIEMVRDKLVVLQKEIGKKRGVVMDGRDIGTKVFPDAELKFFVTATSIIRAERRFGEMLEKKEEVNFDAVLSNILERDEMDSNRKINPLRIAKDAIIINNSDMT